MYKMNLLEKELRSYVLWDSDIDGQFGVKEKEKKQIKQITRCPTAWDRKRQGLRVEGDPEGVREALPEPPGLGDLGGT